MRRFLVGLVIASIAAATPIGAFAGDKEIAQHILQKIDAEKKAGKLRGFDVNLRVENGHVWLSGQVASQQQMQKLLHIASHTSHLGTKQVHKQLRVARLDRPVAESAKASSRFPNLLAVFNREDKATVKKAEPRTAPAPKQSVSRKAPASQLTSSRRTFRNSNADLDSNRASGVDKQRTSHAVAGKTASVPTRHARPTRQANVAKAAPARHSAPLPAPRHRQIALASGEATSPAPQSISAPAIKPVQTVNPTPAVRPTQAQLTPLAPIPQSQENASAVVAGQLTKEQFAAMYQEYLAQVQQAREYYAQMASMNQTPVAFAPAASAPGAAGSAPIAAPNYIPTSHGPVIHHDHPSMPSYAWPGYAAHPNYAALTYPKQYAPSAWPYIGPFYPYPQVPLGWRKVQLEWDDGWWFLNFKNRHFR